MKSVPFWENWIKVWDLAVVVDLSPGSGALAAACMRSGVQYLGICASNAHVSWLTNQLTKTALQQISDAKSPLFLQDIAAQVREIFADFLDVDDAGDVEGSASSTESPCRLTRRRVRAACLRPSW